MTKSDFFDDQENFSKTILPKNVGKFRALDPIQRRLDYFSKFFRDCSKKCLAGMWIRSRTRTRTQLLTIQFFHFQGRFIRENIQVF